MKYELDFQSLRQLAVVSVGGKVVNLMFRFYAKDLSLADLVLSFSNFDDITRLIGETLKALKIPDPLKPEVFEVASEIWSHVCKALVAWLQFKCDHVYPLFMNEVWKILYFTSSGELDLQRMQRDALRRITKNKVDGLDRDFNLACEFCLDDVAPEIYQKMSAKEKAALCEDKSYWHDLVCQCDGIPDEASVSSKCEDLLSKSLSRWRINQHVVLYYWDRLIPAKKQALAVQCFDYALHNQIPKFMCRTMPHLEQKDLDRIEPQFAFQISLCFLRWPYSELFLPIITNLWKHISVHHCAILFLLLMQKRCFSHHSRFQRIMQEFWSMCSPDIKHNILQNEPWCTFFLQQLLAITDKEMYRELINNLCEMCDCRDEDELLKKVNAQAFKMRRGGCSRNISHCF